MVVGDLIDGSMKACKMLSGNTDGGGLFDKSGAMGDAQQMQDFPNKFDERAS